MTTSRSMAATCSAPPSLGCSRPGLAGVRMRTSAVVSSFSPNDIHTVDSGPRCRLRVAPADRQEPWMNANVDRAATATDHASAGARGIVALITTLFFVWGFATVLVD